MEVEPLESFEVGRRFDLGAERAEARAGGAGVVEFDVDLGVLRVDAEAEGELAAGREGGGLVALPLRRGIEGDVVGDAEEVGELLILKGRRVGMDFAAEFLAAEERLVDAAGGGAHEILRDQLRFAELGEALEREEDLGAGAVHHRAQDAEVLFQQAAMEDMARARDLAQVDLAESFGECVGHEGEIGSVGVRCKRKARFAAGFGLVVQATGSSFTCQGRPRLLSSSMNGSGFISSMFQTPGLSHLPPASIAPPMAAGTPVV